jgi:hypothetical protein
LDVRRLNIAAAINWKKAHRKELETGARAVCHNHFSVSKPHYFTLIDFPHLFFLVGATIAAVI